MILYSITNKCTIDNFYILGKKNCLIANRINLITYLFRKKKELKMINKAKIVKEGNYVVEVEEGKTYHWCQCGESSNQPFCDGSHTKTTFKSISFTAEKSGNVYFCGCKQTSNQPFCDGSHVNL